MREHGLIALAAPPALAVIRADQLGASMPGAEYDVHGLIDHMLHWGPTWPGPPDSRSPGTRP